MDAPAWDREGESALTARCIALDSHGARCPYRASRLMGDLQVCRRHSLLHIAILEDRLSPDTRRMLAVSRWNTAEEGQVLIDRLVRRAA